MNPPVYIFYKDPSFYLFALGSFLAIKSVASNNEAMVALLVFYLFENIVMGLFAVVKMRVATQPPLSDRPGIGVGSFATILGLFLFLHVGALVIIATVIYGVNTIRLATPPLLVLSFALLLGRYVVDAVRFFLKKEYLRITPAEAQGFVFLRVIVFHISTVLGLIFQFIPFASIFFPLKIAAEFLEFVAGRTAPQFLKISEQP